MANATSTSCSALVGEIGAELAAAQEQSQKTAKPARRFKDFTWQTRESWSRARRVVAKAEWTVGEANPRFVVTSLAREDHEARHLYERALLRPRRVEQRDRPQRVPTGLPARSRGAAPEPGAAEAKPTIADRPATSR
jgi:hypothetical protein